MPSRQNEKDFHSIQPSQIIDALHANAWRQCVQASEKSYFTKAKDHSMQGAGIKPRPNEVLIVDPLAQCEDGKIILFTHKGELFIRRYFFRNGRAEMRSENAYFETLFLDPSEFEYMGVIVNSIRKFD